MPSTTKRYVPAGVPRPPWPVSNCEAEAPKWGGLVCGDVVLSGRPQRLGALVVDRQIGGGLRRVGLLGDHVGRQGQARVLHSAADVDEPGREVVAGMWTPRRERLAVVVAALVL